MHLTRAVLKLNYLFMPVHVVDHTKTGLKLAVAAQSKSATGEGVEGKAGKGEGAEVGAGVGAGVGKGAGVGAGAGAGRGAAERIAQEAWLSGEGGTGEWAGI